MQQLTRAHTIFKSFVSKQEDTNNTDQEQEHRALVKHTSAMWAHVARASGHRSDNCGHKTQKQTAPPPSSSPADRGQSFADCLALLFGTVCVSMSAFVRMHTSCHSWSLATPPTARPTAGCHWRVPAHSLTVWPECRGGGEPKQARELSQPRLTVTSFYLLIHSAVYLIHLRCIYVLTHLKRTPSSLPISFLSLCSEQTNRTAW